ncbi:Phage tail fiber repeat protein [compost metagenome]
MATWGTNGLTNRGRVLQNKAQAGVQLKYTKIVIGDGQLGNQSIGPLLGVISPKMTVPITRLRLSGDSALIGMTFNNDAVTVGFTWREIGIYAQDPDLGEIMYFYANAGTTGSYIPPGGGSDIVEMSYDQNVFVGTAQNITAEINESLVYATRQELDEVLQESKTYTDTQIANVKVPDASTTQKGIIKLSADYKSTSSTTVPNSKALSDLYTDSLADKGKPFMDDFNFLLGAGRWRIDRSSFTPATDHSPPGAYPKGVLFVASSNVTEGLVVVHMYVDDTGGIYNRVRTIAGTWLPWDGLASKTYAQRNLRLERAVEFGADVAGVGPAFFDFHTSGNAVDYDSRIIAEGGNATTGNGKLTLQATTTAITGQVETSGQVWVAKNTQFGSTSGLSLPIGDSDTGFNWFGDGGVDFYSNNSKVAALSDGVFKYYEADGSWKVLRDEISNLKHSSVDKFTKIANAINGKGGNANASMTGDEFAAAISNLPVKRFASGTFNGQTAIGTNWNGGVSINLAVNGLAFSPSRVFIRARFSDSRDFTVQVDAIVMADTTGGNIVASGWRNNYIGFSSSFVQVPGGFTLGLWTSKIDQYAGSSSDLPKIMVYQWWGYE